VPLVGATVLPAEKPPEAPDAPRETFETLLPVVVRTTVGMMITDVPAVLIGDRVAHRINLKYVRWVLAPIFASLEILALTGVKFF
jgi:Ca2+/H+ antiporter, TMEM165/GDT1 family